MLGVSDEFVSVATRCALVTIPDKVLFRELLAARGCSFEKSGVCVGAVRIAEVNLYLLHPDVAASNFNFAPAER